MNFALRRGSFLTIYTKEALTVDSNKETTTRKVLDSIVLTKGEMEVIFDDDAKLECHDMALHKHIHVLLFDKDAGIRLVIPLARANKLKDLLTEMLERLNTGNKGIVLTG